MRLNRGHVVHITGLFKLKTFIEENRDSYIQQTCDWIRWRLIRLIISWIISVEALGYYMCIETEYVSHIQSLNNTAALNAIFGWSRNAIFKYIRL